MKIYITFGQEHVHHVFGITYNKSNVAVIECDDYAHGRRLAEEYFGLQFGTSYREEEITEEFLSFFPDGLVPVVVPITKQPEFSAFMEEHNHASVSEAEGENVSAEDVIIRLTKWLDKSIEQYGMKEFDRGVNEMTEKAKEVIGGMHD